VPPKDNPPSAASQPPRLGRPQPHEDRPDPTQRPATAARMYDYFLGGYHNFPADREAVQAVIAQLPTPHPSRSREVVAGSDSNGSDRLQRRVRGTRRARFPRAYRRHHDGPTYRPQPPGSGIRSGHRRIAGADPAMFDRHRRRGSRRTRDDAVLEKLTTGRSCAATSDVMTGLGASHMSTSATHVQTRGHQHRAGEGQAGREAGTSTINPPPTNETSAPRRVECGRRGSFGGEVHG
jgi:hypothetical protein